MKSILAFVVAAGLAWSASAESAVERLIASYDGVQSAQVEIRRDTQAHGANTRRLSRVYFQRHDRLHVESVTPPRRRIVADGTRLYSYIEGDPKGFSRPVEALDADWLVSLRQVPGTAMDHLLRIRGVPEETLPGTEDFPTRVGVSLESRYVVVNLDPEGRLARLEFFVNATQSNLLARYEYENFHEAAPGAWFALLQKAGLRQGQHELVETTRLSNLVVNKPIPAHLFQHGTFFDGVRFTSDLDELYGK